MLAAKMTCRDRWCQILDEADGIPTKHLLTLQERVSEAQFAEMTSAGVRLVVPAGLTEKLLKSVQPAMQTLESFIGDIRGLESVSKTVTHAHLPKRAVPGDRSGA